MNKFLLAALITCSLPCFGMQNAQGCKRAAISPDGHSMLIGLNDGTVRLISADTGTLLKVFYGHFNTVTSVAFSPDGKHVAGGDGNTVYVWDVEYAEVTQKISGPTDIAASTAFNS